MTKKHYEAIAGILRYYLELQIDEWDRRDLTPEECDALEQATYDIAERLADYFEQENPRFLRDRFLKACGIEHTCLTCSGRGTLGHGERCLNCNE